MRENTLPHNLRHIQSGISREAFWEGQTKLLKRSTATIFKGELPDVIAPDRNEDSSFHSPSKREIFAHSIIVEQPTCCQGRRETLTGEERYPTDNPRRTQSQDMNQLCLLLRCPKRIQDTCIGREGSRAKGAQSQPKEPRRTANDISTSTKQKSGQGI